MLAMMFMCMYNSGGENRGARKFILLMKHEDVELIQSARDVKMEFRKIRFEPLNFTNISYSFNFIFNPSFSSFKIVGSNLKN